MPQEIILGDLCYTAAEVEKLLARIREKCPAKVSYIHGQWLYFIDLQKGSGLDKVHQLLQIPRPLPSPPSNLIGDALEIYITPRNITPWSSKATSIAHVCGLQDEVRRIERGRYIVIGFEESYDRSQELSFRDIIHDRMLEVVNMQRPDLITLFAQGERNPLVVVDIFNDERGPLAALQDYNKQSELGLDEANMEYLVEEFKKLGRSPNDVELFMFAQVNSEHCKSKSLVDIFLSYSFPSGRLLTTRQVDITSSMLHGPLMGLQWTRACLR
jgi:phosphoribosylformylglycinamidine synthase